MSKDGIKNPRANKLLDKPHLTESENLELLELLEKEEPSPKRDAYIEIAKACLKGIKEEKETFKLVAGKKYDVESLIKDLKNYPKDAKVEIVKEAEKEETNNG